MTERNDELERLLGSVHRWNDCCGCIDGGELPENLNPECGRRREAIRRLFARCFTEDEVREMLIELQARLGRHPPFLDWQANAIITEHRKREHG